jgi:aminoglycoside phosphotransferase (APT) family kinase protein
MAPSKDNRFNCLNHGDCWISNVLFLNDENGNVTDCAFIDFQQCVYTSPSVDLLTFIITSASTDTKMTHFDYFVRIYHGHLVEALNLLGYTENIPTLKELYMDVIDRAFLAVWNCFAMLPACLIEESVEDSSSDNLMADDEDGQNYRRKLFNNERYRKHLTELLTFFDNRGLVELH